MEGEEGRKEDDRVLDGQFEDTSDDDDALVAFMREGAAGAGGERENAEGSDGDEDDDGSE